MMICSGSIHNSYATNPVVMEDLDKILAIELREAILFKATSLVEAVFPDKYLPLPINEDIVDSRIWQKWLDRTSY